VYSGAITVAPADSTSDPRKPSAQGTLEKTPLPHLLVYAHDKRLTGTFEFEGPDGQAATLLSIEGQPTKVRTTESVIYLGKALVDLGMITQEQHDESIPGLLASTELHGQRLMAAGLITDEQLELALRAQLIRKMHWLVCLPPETTFKYFDAYDALHSFGGEGHVGIDPFPVVWGCIRSAPPWEHVNVGLTRIGTSGIRLTAEAETDRFSFDKAERGMIELLRQQPWRLRELTAEAGMAPQQAQLLAYCLLVTKQVEVVRESQLPASPEEIEPPPSSPFPTAEIRPAVAPNAQRVARVQLAQVTLARQRAAVEEDVSSPDVTADVAAGKSAGATSYVATQPRTKRSTTNAEALLRAAEQPSPASPREAVSSPVSDPPPPSPPVMPRAPESSPHSTQVASVPPPKRTKPPIVVNEDDAPPSSNPSSNRAAHMSAELAARKKEILDKANGIEKEDYFAVLGVTRETPTSEIQRSFFALAKKWHPDRVPAVLADVKDVCAKVFSRMSEAHQTLMDPQKRAKYEMTLRGDGDDSAESQAKVVAILEAATNFQKAEICLKRNDTKQAEEFCKKALDVDPNQADYVAMMAWLQSLKPVKQDSASTQEQVVELTRAISISQACERAFFYRAMLLKRLGDEARAIKDFKRAVELNPRNVDAQREVRLYNMRGGGPTKPGGKKEEGGIFGKLFKK
jgi:tetratricopeptide (TPR) repeat protein